MSLFLKIGGHIRRFVFKNSGVVLKKGTSFERGKLFLGMLIIIWRKFLKLANCQEKDTSNCYDWLNQKRVTGYNNYKKQIERKWGMKNDELY